jgi:hypothetical protein
MTTFTLSTPAVAEFSDTRGADAHRRQRQFRRLGRLTGLLFLVTYATSIPPVLAYYVPALSDPAFVLGGGFDASISWGALLELMLIAANIGTALALYPVLRRRFEVLSLGYLVARLIECGFIAVGILALMALNTLRLEAVGADEGALRVAAAALVAVHDWTFRLGPGIVVGIGNGLILGWMLWITKLVPRALSVLGLVGGPVLLGAGVAVLFGVLEAGSVAQGLATLPEFLWELSLGVWLLAKGFDPVALAALDESRA